MTRLHQLIAFFATPAERQIEALADLPFDRGDSRYHSAFAENPLWLLVWGLLEEAGFRDTEPAEEAAQRTGLPDETGGTALPELLWCATSLRQLGRLDGDPLFTARALRDHPSWKVVRRLAAATLSDLGWTPGLETAEIRNLLDHCRRESRRTRL